MCFLASNFLICFISLFPADPRSGACGAARWTCPTCTGHQSCCCLNQLRHCCNSVERRSCLSETTCGGLTGVPTWMAVIDQKLLLTLASGKKDKRGGCRVIKHHYICLLLTTMTRVAHGYTMVTQ
jgi:hypothetical protein